MMGIGSVAGIGVNGKDDVKVSKPESILYKKRNIKSFKKYVKDNQPKTISLLSRTENNG